MGLTYGAGYGVDRRRGSRLVASALDPLLAELFGPPKSSSPGTATAVGGIGSSSNHGGAALGVDGAVYGGPRSATTILRSAGGVVTRSNLGAALGGSGSHFGLCEGADGCLYGAPNNTGAVLKIDPAAGTAELTQMGSLIPAGSARFAGIVANPDQTALYCIPSDATYIVIIYPLAQTLELWSPAGVTLSGTGQYRFASVWPDGRIFCVPYNAANVLVIDTVSKTASVTNYGLGWSANQGLWYGSAITHDRRIVCGAFNATSFLVIEPDTNTALLEDFGAGALLAGTAKWTKPIRAADNKLYLPPYDRSKVGIIDPAAGTFGESDFGLGLVASSKYVNGCNSADGTIDLIPLQAQDVVRIGPFAGSFSTALLHSAYLNAN